MNPGAGDPLRARFSISSSELEPIFDFSPAITKFITTDDRTWNRDTCFGLVLSPLYRSLDPPRIPLIVGGH